MYRSKKVISIMLVVIIMLVSNMTGCKKGVGETISDLVGGIFDKKIKHEVTEEATLPKRPFIIEEIVEEKDIGVFLAAEQVSAKTILIEPELETGLLEAETLDQIADSRTKVENLKSIRAELTGMLEIIKDDERVDRELIQKTGTFISKIDQLFQEGIILAKDIKPSIGLLATWTTPDKVVLRWMPQKDWIPEGGYDLFRVIEGKTELIADSLGSQEHINRAEAAGRDYSDYIGLLYENGKMTAQAMSEAKASNAREFNDYLFSAVNPVINKYRFSGEEDFGISKVQTFSIKGTLAQRVPFIDREDKAVISTGGSLKSLPLPLDLAKSSLSVQFVSSQSKLPGLEISSNIKLIAESRNDLLTIANTDIGFAEASGFGYEDELKGQNINKDELIEYVLVPRKPENSHIDLAYIASGARSDGTFAIKVKYGTEVLPETPAKLDGYGADGAVYIRWTAPEEQYMKSIISGYYIERKKNKESKFTRITDVPVAISYTQDENGIYFEMPVFFVDNDITNGDRAIYRIQATDIFGRMGEYTDELDVTVYKVIPPNAPNVGQPVLSSADPSKHESFIRETVELNKGKTGIVLPIAKTSDDTVEFVVYKSSALGKNGFEAPIQAARIPVEKDNKETAKKKTVRYNDVRLIINPVSETGVHTVYFDTDIKEGSYYKYWVAAVDEWGNESGWSSARTLGYPSTVATKEPLLPEAAMEVNSLPEKAIDVPGFSTDRLITQNSEEKPAQTEFAKVATLSNVTIGKSLSDIERSDVRLTPELLAFQYGNLPEPKDIHDMIALEGKDLLAGGTARVSWHHYAGAGLKGYHIYRTYSDVRSLDEISEMSREELIKAFFWTLVTKDHDQNLLMDKPEIKEGRIYIYLVFLVPEPEKSSSGILDDAMKIFIPGGWVRLSWQEPDDPQIGYYRVYRTEVPYFDETFDADKAEWTMVVDNLKYTGYTEKTDQTFAHYYYYKITSVSLWGVESEKGAVTGIRVPATSPPDTPSMLLPFSQKGKVQIKWVGVPHASKYILFRRMLPKVSEEDVTILASISPKLFTNVFTPQALSDTFLTQRITTGISTSNELKIAPITQDTQIQTVSKFNTLQLVSKKTTLANISQITVNDKTAIYKDVVNKYGVLAVAPYGQLDIDMAKLVVWDKVAEIEIERGEPSTGVFDFTDEDVLFGDTYLYTVQAVNDDLLYSGRPDPVTVSPRKASPFPALTSLSGTISSDYNMPALTWAQAKEPNLTWKESREHIAGYLVYKSNSENGRYYQASELLTETEFMDRKADINAANWYKVKVVDTGGFISGFSNAIKVQKAPDFLIPNIKKIIPLPSFKLNPASLQSESIPVLSPLTFQIQPIKPIQPIRPIQPVQPDTLTLSGFTLTGITPAVLTAGSGDAVLKIGDKYEVDVTINIARRSGTLITVGSASLKQPVGFDDIGVYIRQLSISTADTEATISGYVKNTKEGDLLGDMYSLRFDQAKMTTGAVIKIMQTPEFHYDNLSFERAELITVNLGGIKQSYPIRVDSIINTVVMPVLVYGSSFISIFNGKVTNDLGLEMLDNKGLKLAYGMMGFDYEGKLNGEMTLDATQVVRTVVPAGLGIKVTAAKLVYKSGAADAVNSSIAGRVLLPFSTFDDTLPVEFDTDLFIKTYSDKKVVMTDIKLHDKLVVSTAGSVSLDTSEKGIVDRGMYYLASRIQSNALKVLPMDITLQEKLSSVPFSVQSWGGKGFIVQDAAMTPALVGNADEEIGITPGRVALDLSREEAYTGQAPADVKVNDWMGIVVKNGRVGLPPAFIKTDDDQRVLFKLTPGELLYDRNGVFYQNQAYSEEGIPVNFGDSLGGFKDVIVYLIYLDMYNNKVSLEIQGEVGIPLFGYQRVKVRLYTSKELGKLVCSVAQTEKFDPSGSGNIFIKILGGHLKPDGLHMDGTIDLVFDGKMVSENMTFIDLIIPSDMVSMTASGNTDEIYGRALFDKPYRIKFHDFEMDLRALSIDSFTQVMQASMMQQKFINGHDRQLKLSGITIPISASIPFFRSDITLWGGMQLSDNLAMDMNEDFDRLVISGVFTVPKISYEESKSKLELDFEDFASVKATAVPVLSESDDGIIEYNTDALEMVFNSSGSLLSSVPVEANVRLGYDKTMSRYFFALAIYYHDPTGGIQLGFGTLNDITGVIGYNLDLPFDAASGYSFPNSKDGFFKSIDELEVNRTPSGNYFFAATAWMFLGYETASGSYKLGELRNIYLVVEKGPNVEMGGDYYGPATVESLITGNNLKKMGTARLGYYHSSRLFKFSLSLYDFGMYGTTVSGDLGFDMSPTLWEIRIGYPETLSARMGVYTGGFGFTIRYSELPDDSFVKAKMFFGYDTGDVSISIVYFRAYLFAGGEGEYYFDSGNFVLRVFIEGGLEGGIKVKGKKYKIIHMMVGADGTLTRYSGNWNLDANVRVHYHLDLFLFSVGGSVNWHVSKDF